MPPLGRRLIQGEGSTGHQLSASTNPPAYKFALDLSTRLQPGTYRVQLYRHPRTTRIPTIHTLSIIAYIDSPTTGSAPKVVESSTSNARLDHITFSVGIPNVANTPIRYVCEGRSSAGNYPFIWAVEIDKQRTLPFLMLQPFRKASRGVVRAVRHPLAHGARPMIGAAQNLGAGGGRLVRRATNIW
ncbi:hypothetical protein BT69DRAFT_1348650 [Atractiella rhizophila]|nr:hypothetical protein BT69DRAFT_1348650 [Atractiella rhizophila]